MCIVFKNEFFTKHLYVGHCSKLVCLTWCVEVDEGVAIWRGHPQVLQEAIVLALNHVTSTVNRRPALLACTSKKICISDSYF